MTTATPTAAADLRGLLDRTRLRAARLARAARAADPDDTVNGLVAALDAIIDEAAELLNGAATLPADAQQARDLLTGAEAIVDKLMDMLGIPDPDDLADAGQAGAPAPGRAAALVLPPDVRQARAGAYASRSIIPGAQARLQPFAATWRHEAVRINGKDLHQLDGYSSIVGIEYEMWDCWGPYGETVAPGAFDATLAAEPDVAFLVNHKGVTMARTTNATLQLDANERGEHVLAYVNPARVDVSDLLVAIDDKNITEMSFAFMITEGEWDDDFEHFTILQVDQDRGDVSAVNYGANPYTEIAARSREVMHDLMALPAGAQRAALERLTERFGGVLVPSAGGPGLDELGPLMAGRALAARNSARRVTADPVADAARGRSVKLVQALLDAGL